MRPTIAPILVALLVLALPASAGATVHANKVFCGQERVEHKQTPTEAREARYGRIFITITPQAMSAVYRQDPRNWASRQAATCELAELVTSEAVDYGLDEINIYDPGFIAKGASWYVGRYHCIPTGSTEPPGWESGEITTCTHTGRYANSVSFWLLEYGETRTGG